MVGNHRALRRRYVVEPVTGGSFPIDMLRYDGSYPAQETDAGRITRTFRRGENVLGDTAVTLEKVAERGWRPNDDRWRSFGWRVTSLE